MRDQLITLLLIAVGVLGYLVHSRDVTIARQKSQIRELLAKTKASGIELQEKCSERGDVYFRSTEMAKDSSSWHENHYNDRLNRCIVVLASHDEEHPQISVTRYIDDSLEGKQLGQFVGAGPVGDYVLFCDITLPSGEQKNCRSWDEFQELSKAWTH